MLDLSAGKVAPATGNDDMLALVRAVSHAVLNDLAVLRLLLDISRDPMVAADPETGLDAAVERVARMGGVVQQLGLASRTDGNREVADVGELLREAMDLLEVAAGSRTTLVLELPVGPVVADVDTGEVLQRVLTAVLAVAREVEPGSTITLTLVADPLGPFVTLGDMPMRLRLS